MKQQLRDVSNTPTPGDDEGKGKDEKNHHRQREGARKSTRRGGGAATTTTTTQHHHHNHQMVPSSLNDNAPNTTTTANTTTGEKRWQVKIISPTDENFSLFFLGLSFENLNFFGIDFDEEG